VAYAFCRWCLNKKNNMLGQKVRSTCHNAIRHDSQLVTPFYGVTSWPCDELTGSLISLLKFHFWLCPVPTHREPDVKFHSFHLWMSYVIPVSKTKPNPNHNTNRNLTLTLLNPATGNPVTVKWNSPLFDEQARNTILTMPCLRTHYVWDYTGH